MSPKTRMLAGAVLIASAIAAGTVLPGSRTVAAQIPRAAEMPAFEVDPAWPKLPNNWVLGHVPSVGVDRHDHVWILHRPNTIPADKRANAAPPVLEFDANGKFLNAWGGPGGPGQRYDWPDSEHGITIDHKDRVWIGGSSPTSQSPTKRSDDMLLRFTNTGKFLLQIGGRDASRGNADTKSVKKAADAFVYAKTNETFVADGYGNRRVIVFDADSGAFKRMWGGFGNVPEDADDVTGPPPANAKLDVDGPGSQQFGGPVHGIKVSDDGFVYVADRRNRRVQVFTVDGKYVTQVFINRAGPNAQSAAGIAFSPDKNQRFMYIVDYGNSHIVVLDRKKLEVLYQFGTRSGKPGDFQGVHHMAVDSKGNIYTAEVSPGNRAQRFVYKGLSSTLPPNAESATRLSAAP